MTRPYRVFRRVRLGLCAVMVLATLPTAAVANDGGLRQATLPPAVLRVGCIDLAYVAANSKHGKLATGELQTLTRKKQTELEERAKSLGAQEAQLKASAATLAEPARLELEHSVRKAQLDFARFREDSQSEVKQFAERVERELRAKLFPIVDEISREKGLALVFTVDAPGLVWFSQTLDVSREVVERLDRTPQ